MQGFIESSLARYPFLKRLGIIVISLLLAIIFDYFTTGAGSFICFLIFGLFVGYFSFKQYDLLSNGILFGAFFLIGINILHPVNHDANGIILIFILMPFYGAIPGIIVSAIGYLMKKNPIIGLMLMAIPLVSSQIWFTFYPKPEYAKIPIIFATLPALFVCLLTNLKMWKVSFVTTIGGIAAIIMKIIIDVHKDATSHNLLPFEIILFGVVFFVTSFASSAIGTAIRLLIKKNKENKRS